MGKRQRQAERYLGINKKSKEPVVSFNNPFKKYAMDWYLTSWFEKLIYVFGILSIFYSVTRIIVQGVW